MFGQCSIFTDDIMLNEAELSPNGSNEMVKYFHFETKIWSECDSSDGVNIFVIHFANVAQNNGNN